MAHDTLLSLHRQAETLITQPVIDATALKLLVSQLKQVDDFGFTRQLLARASERLEQAEQVWAIQQQAFCTYQDPALATEQRHADALELLASIGLRDPQCSNATSLGMAGAIYKRMWESTGNREHLLTALAFYRAGWQRNPQQDMGWCGISAAFVMNLLDHQQRITQSSTGRPASGLRDWGAEADALRLELLEKLQQYLPAGSTPGYWYLATLAEACFGLGRYDEARDWLQQAVACGPNAAQQRLTAQQLTRLAHLQRIAPPAAGAQPQAMAAAWQALQPLCGDNLLAITQGWRGKVGLALSGGGFRASLFHLGVLARLAECDVLRCVETLSTVSGGSILGAQYYLELRQLLQDKPDGEISRDDYIALVQRLIAATVAGVQHNLRVAALSDFRSNMQMFAPDYSRTQRMGELYEHYLYRQVQDAHPADRPRELRELRIQPATAAEAFNPRQHNWLRCARVPNLILNTTSLNTGHSWQFTASWMGEPPGLVGDEIDINERYRRLYYEQAPASLQGYPLAWAVAASSCVPALFEPIAIHDLYHDRTLRLVDGGVHDNQGASTLLDDGCDFILCSDASGQMDSQADPGGGILGVFARSDAILQDRLREAQYRELHERASSGRLRGLFFVHLKQELDSEPVSWIGCQDTPASQPQPSATRYGVDRELQRYLSEIRTDLDTFSEVESYSLMASGYLMTAQQLRDLDHQHRRDGYPGSWGGFDIDAAMTSAQDSRWAFAPLIPLLALPEGSSDLRRQRLGAQLRAGKCMFMRVLQLDAGLKKAVLASGLLGGAVALTSLLASFDQLLTGSLALPGWLLLLLGLPLIGKVATSLGQQPLAWPLFWPVRAAIAASACAGSRLFLRYVNPRLQKYGRLDRLL